MAWEFGPVHSQIAWECPYLGVMTIKGLFTRAEVALDVSGDDSSRWWVDAKVDAASIESGNARRDDALRGPDYLDVERYPTIRYVSRRLERHNGDYRASGDLTIHGVTRPVVLDLAYRGEATGSRGQEYRVLAGELSVNRTDYGVGAPSGPGTGVGETLRISLQIELVRQE